MVGLPCAESGSLENWLIARPCEMRMLAGTGGADLLRHNLERGRERWSPPLDQPVERNGGPHLSAGGFEVFDEESHGESA